MAQQTPLAVAQQAPATTAGTGYRGVPTARRGVPTHEQKVFTDSQMSQIKYIYYTNNVLKD
jgi:hypothetical protein